jgi:hypothetical protein
MLIIIGRCGKFGINSMIAYIHIYLLGRETPLVFTVLAYEPRRTTILNKRKGCQGF